MNVWVVEESPPYESSMIIGIYATKELADTAATKELYADYITVNEWYVHE